MNIALSRHTYHEFNIYDKAYSLAAADLSVARESAVPNRTTIDMLTLTLAMLNASRALAWEHYCETINWYPEDWNSNNRRDAETLQEHVREMTDSDGHNARARFGTASSIDASRYRQTARMLLED